MLVLVLERAKANPISVKPQLGSRETVCYIRLPCNQPVRAEQSVPRFFGTRRRSLAREPLQFRALRRRVAIERCDALLRANGTGLAQLLRFDANQEISWLPLRS